MKNNYLYFILFLALTATASTVNAQDYEFRVQHLGESLVVMEARFVGAGTEPTNPGDALLDFTLDLRWPVAAGLDITDFTDTGGYTVSRAGTELVDGDTEYQGFALSVAPAFLPEPWLRDQWIEMFTVQFSAGVGPDEEIVIGEPGDNPVNPGIPNINMSGIDFTPTINGSAILPIELLDFRAEAAGNKSALLTWKTILEENASHFAVQRSVNATEWDDIGEVVAVGESRSEQSYQFDDLALPAVSTVYYRLNMLDLDGSQAYSDIESINLTSVDFDLQVFPNPTSGRVAIQTGAALKLVTVYGSTGQILLQAHQPVIDLSNQPAGVYFVRVDTDAGTFQQSVVRR